MSIIIRDLHFSYPGEPSLLQGVNLTIQPGERVGIIGRNGSGKTTLIKHLNGLLLPSSGSVEIDGTLLDPQAQKKRERKLALREFRKKVGYLFQFPREQLFGATVLQDISQGVQNFGYTKEEALTQSKQMMKRLSLPKELADRSPLQLSGGETRKVALAGLFAVNPSILVLDEPTIGLDSASVHELFSALHEQQQRGMTTIIISNSMEHLWDRVDRIVILSQGAIIADGPSHLILQDKELLESTHMVLPGHISFKRALEQRVCKNLSLPEDSSKESLDRWVAQLEKELFV